MARVPPLKSFRREDFPDQPWIDRLFAPLNQFLLFTVQALSGSLTFADNIRSQTKTLSVSADGSGNLVTISYKSTIGKPSGLLIVAAHDSTSKAAASVSACPAWAWDGKDQVKLSALGGLTASHNYTLTLLALGG